MQTGHLSSAQFTCSSQLTMHAVLPTRKRYPTDCCVIDEDVEELVWFNKGSPAVWPGLVKAISTAPAAKGKRYKSRSGITPTFLNSTCRGKDPQQPGIRKQLGKGQRFALLSSWQVSQAACAYLAVATLLHACDGGQQCAPHKNGILQHSRSACWCPDTDAYPH